MPAGKTVEWVTTRVLNRRSFLRGLSVAVAAPAIVRAASLMPVKAFFNDGTFMPTYGGFGPVQIYRASPQMIALLEQRMKDAGRITIEGMAKLMWPDYRDGLPLPLPR